MMFEPYLGVVMVVVLFALLMLGYPVAFTLGGVSLIFGIIGLDIYEFRLLPQRIWGIVDNFTLLAVPLFVFMGVTLERTGVAERLLEAMAGLLHRVRSGLALSVVVAGALLAASTGIVGASVVTMGLISLPTMLKNGYPKSFSTGLICASGTLGQIIPPSIILVLLGDIMGVPVGELFVAAVVPGLMLVGCYLLYSLFYCRGRASLMVTTERTVVFFSRQMFAALVPPGLLVLAVLGTIFFGIASPTEAAAVGAFGALCIGYCAKELSFDTLTSIVETTLKITSMVFIILVGATSFGLVFRELGGDEVLVDMILALNTSEAVFIAVVMVLLFVAGCFLDFIEITFIVVPLLVPLIEEYHLNPLWFAVLIAVNLQMSFLTPPFGFSLFYLKGVAPPEVSSSDIYRGIVPFVLIQAFVLSVVIAFPELVLWLPSVTQP